MSRVRRILQPPVTSFIGSHILPCLVVSSIGNIPGPPLSSSTSTTHQMNAGEGGGGGPPLSARSHQSSSEQGGGNNGQEGFTTNKKKYAPRETSLLVSPVSYHTRSPQSEVFLGTTTSRQSNNDGQHHSGQQMQQHGPTGTPMMTSSADAVGSNRAGERRQDSVTPSTAGLTIHTNLQQNHHHQSMSSNNNNQYQNNSGRDPTPYHYRSNPSTSPSFNNDKKKTSDASSRSGRDPPAKSPFPTSIHATPTHHHSQQQHGSSYTTGFATNKSTPNVHSHHYQKQQQYQQQHQLAMVSTQQQQENELSMIQEDESHSGGGGVDYDGQSMVSNVTGSTFVRTPIIRKQHHQHHASNNNNHATTPRNNSGSGGGSASRTPRNTTQYTHTPGSITSTTIQQHTPSTSQLINRPSLAMRESLAHLASSTSHALEEIWDSIGVSPDERASQLLNLVEEISSICDAKVANEEGLRNQFQKEINEARCEWQGICKALKLDDEEDPISKLKRDPSAKDLSGNGGCDNESGVTLEVELEAILGRLESLRSVKLSAMTDMENSQGRIYEAYAALNGCSVDEASDASELQSFMDIESDLTLERREELRSKAVEYEESVASRTKAVISLVLDCQGMIRELEIVPPSQEVAVGNDVDDVKIMNSLQAVVDNNNEGGNNAAAESRDDYQQHHNRHRGKSNDYTIVSLFETPTCIGISTSSLDRLTSRIAELNGEKRRRRAKLAEMGTTISSLWQMLRVPPEEQLAFTSSIRGLGLDTLRKGEAEIGRLEELKAVMIGKLVREQRSMIEELWDKTNSSVAERASFNAYFHITDDEQLTSDILMKHEEYVSSLKAKLGKMQPILDLIAKREAILDERSELEILQKDPDRLKGRGASVTKQLMKEEKMNRHVTKELPKITSILEKTLRQWYVENKPNTDGEEGQVEDPDLGHFMYQGSPYLKTMQYQEEEWRTRKERAEEERQRKKLDERAAASSASAAFGYTTYTKLPGKKSSYVAGGASSTRPRSASNVRSGSNMRSGGSSRPASSSSTASGGNRSGSNMRFGGRGPLGDVSSKQNTSRPPSRPRGPGAGAGGDRGKKVVAGGRGGYRPASAPRMRM